MNTIVVSGRCFLEPELFQNEENKVMISFVIADNGFNGREKTVERTAQQKCLYRQKRY